MKDLPMRKGIRGEKSDLQALRIGLNDVEDRLCIEHTDFKNYTYGEGLDLKIYDSNGQKLIAIEVKNWMLRFRPYGTETVIRQIDR